MNILMVTGIYPPDLGGPASYVPRMAEALVRRGHRVEVVCLSDGLSHDDAVYPFAVHRIRRGLFWPWRLAVTLWRIWRSALQSDVIYVNGLGSEAALAALAALRPSVHKVVGDYAWERAVGRGWFSGSIDEYQLAPKGLLLGMADMVRTVPLHLARAVIVPSRYLREKVCGWGVSKQKVEVVYNAVDLESGLGGTASPPSVARGVAPEASTLGLVPGSWRGPELPAWSGKTVVTVCRLVEWKGVDGLIRVIAELPQTRLVVVGDGPLRGWLEELAGELAVADRVLFQGSIAQARVRAQIQLGDAFVLNSSYEGLPHVVLEAMAAGVPVVATAAGGTAEVVENNVTGLLVAPGDRLGLRMALERLWKSPSLGEALCKAARAQLAERFSFETMVAETEAALGAAVESSRKLGGFVLERSR